jgi:acetolactate synthase-1/2/3 large subunit
VIDPDAALIDRAGRETGDRLILSAAAEARAAAGTLTRLASGTRTAAARSGAWLAQAREAVGYRPQAWTSLRSRGEGRIHPVEMCRAIQPHLDASPDAVLVCDGGEIGQWAQAALKPARRVINGVAGAIGAAIPFALAARRLEANAPVMAVMGDGTFGFHMAEFDTAVRHDLPFVAVVGNDARWNAEYQIQVREYGKQRAHGCELEPARYDLVVEALGGHGEFVTRATDLPTALKRALASAKPACVNVMIEGAPAPNLRRGG